MQEIMLQRIDGINYRSPNTRNEEMFNKVADLIEAHGDLYDQTRWFDDTIFVPDTFTVNQDGWVTDDEGNADLATHNFCGTHACIAGWATLMSGKVGIRQKNRWSSPQVCLREPVTIDFGFQTATFDIGDAAAGAASHIGRQMLGLDAGEAALLFNSDWRPRRFYTVPDALRLIGEGAVISDLTSWANMTQTEKQALEYTEFFEDEDMRKWHTLTTFQQENVINGTATLDEPGRAYEFIMEDEDEPVIVNITDEPIQQVVDILDAVIADRSQQED